MPTLFVDARYAGAHGIGRYSSEVLPRLDIEHSTLSLKGSPTSMLDVANPGRTVLRHSDVLYSPGFGVGVSLARQVPTVHDLIHVRFPRGRRGALHRQYYERVLKPAIIRGGHVFTVSETAAEDLREWLAPASVSVHNAGNGCSEVFSKEGPRHARAKPYFLYVGNLKPHKNPEPVFTALRQLPGHELVVVTSDTRRAGELAARLGIENRVHVLTSISDGTLATLYRGCVALLFPSVIEGFGLPPLEAMKCGAPVVFYEGCESVREICAGTQYGVSAAHDPDGFLDAMRRAASHPGTVPSLNQYEWGRVAERVSTALRKVISEIGGCLE